MSLDIIAISLKIETIKIEDYADLSEVNIILIFLFFLKLVFGTMP